LCLQNTLDLSAAKVACQGIEKKEGARLHAAQG
jgi:hypothetical protein